MDDYHHYVMVRDISEMQEGRAGYNVLKKMIGDPLHSKLIFFSYSETNSNEKLIQNHSDQLIKLRKYYMLQGI